MQRASRSKFDHVAGAGKMVIAVVIRAMGRSFRIDRICSWPLLWRGASPYGRSGGGGRMAGRMWRTPSVRRVSRNRNAARSPRESQTAASLGDGRLGASARLTFPASSFAEGLHLVDRQQVGVGDGDDHGAGPTDGVLPIVAVDPGGGDRRHAVDHRRDVGRPERGPHEVPSPPLAEQQEQHGPERGEDHDRDHHEPSPRAVDVVAPGPGSRSAWPGRSSNRCAGWER